MATADVATTNNDLTPSNTQSHLAVQDLSKLVSVCVYIKLYNMLPLESR